MILTDAFLPVFRFHFLPMEDQRVWIIQFIIISPYLSFANPQGAIKVYIFIYLLSACQQDCCRDRDNSKAYPNPGESRSFKG